MMSLVKNNSIGMGLACSRDILRKMGGDIWLHQSEEGLTVFKSYVMIEIKNSCRRGNFKRQNIFMSHNRKLKEKSIMYLHENMDEHIESEIDQDA